MGIARPFQSLRESVSVNNRGRFVHHIQGKQAKYTGTWYFMIKNALMQPDYSDPFYSRMKNDVIIDEMKMPFPSLGYKIEF
jgi:hypothetical protein